MNYVCKLPRKHPGMPWSILLRRLHLGSCPAGTVTRTKMISRKKGYYDVNISMINIMVYIQPNPAMKVHNSWLSRKPDNEWTDLSRDKHPCLLHGWAVSHSVKQASSQRRKQQHWGGNTLPSRLHLSADITIWSLKLFSCLTSVDRHLMFCWLETSRDVCQRLSWGQRSSAGKVGRDEWT